MLKFTLTKSMPMPNADEDHPATPTKVSVRKLPGKIAKKVKRQLWRLDEVLHHVTHTKHDPNEPDKAHKQTRARAISTSSTSSSSSRFSSVIRAFVAAPSSPRSTRSQETWSNNSTDIPLSNPVMAEEQLHEHELPEPPVEEVQADDEEPSNSEPMFTSPPTVYVEPEAPDPFLIDEEGDALSGGEEQEDSSAAVSQYTVSPAHNVPLDLPPTPEPSPSPTIVDVPPPPSSDSEQEDDEALDLYVPALVVPTMFLPIPNSDPLTTLLNKYIYPAEKRPARDLTGDWQRSDFHTLVMTNSWRALARMARDRLVTSDPSDLTLILGLIVLIATLIVTALAPPIIVPGRLRLFNQTSAECTNLFNVLNAIDPPETREYVFERMLPFELEVMQTRLKYWAGDHMGYLDALNALLKKCRTKCRQSGDDATLVPMWKERGARVCLIMASQMVEMKQDDVSNPALRSSVARIYLQGGNLQMASKHFALVDADPSADGTLKAMNAALLASAEGDWAEASVKLTAILEKDADNYVVSARGTKGATLYELRSSAGFEKKKELLIEVAKWGGDGLRTNCLKMPAS
ncbi:hypothetical protein BDZ97DRAFT_1755730 [Flammula alnicola]|nr:hypothetical protein BDZ97DRAFT_1755730 [Flammula alnicola]